ncbi:outer membrane protein assembly factor BamD [Gammaproteobacteria bacterium AB-CW1]|uniref:Outer membrane protein assembly factor BamD n=1 Tax=Natronospira elongata TaxID=3110268 RepID=A0AAP6JFP7_9GAMM|nr:outer membrane protein assembly factor BamD [Gammaproteobacteria bacterium AB-CW1]
MQVNRMQITSTGPIRHRLSVRALLLVLSLGLLIGCAGTPEPVQVDTSITAEEIYERAWRRMTAGNYDGAMQMLRALEARHPFTPEGQQAQLDQIYVTHLAGDRRGTAEVARRYIRENPRSDHLDYAYYMQGIAWFDMRSSLSRRILNLDHARLDVTNAHRSFDAFRELVERFPDSEYSQDARLRMIYLRNVIARHNWHVANHYLERGAYMAAAARASKVIEEMQPNEVTPFAMDILAAAYDGVGESSMAADVRSLRGRSFPNHQEGGEPPIR